MKSCVNCGEKNREGSMFCEDCGQPLVGKMALTLPTRELDSRLDEFSSRATWGTARFEEDSLIVLHIRDAPESVTLQPQKRILLGRSDTTSIQSPDCDLTPYGALEKGVSRIHAAIVRNDDTLTLMDMGSSNGTHLNGQRLLPEQPRVLRDGDELRLGKLVAHIYFKAVPSPSAV